MWDKFVENASTVGAAFMAALGARFILQYVDGVGIA